MAESKSIRDRARSLADDAQKRLQDTQGITRDAARKGAARMALGVIDLQRSAFNASMDGLDKLEKRTARVLHDTARSASWVPEEGKEVVDEWINTTKKGRTEFRKSMDKSFDLLKHYFERVQTDGAPKKKAAKKSAAKKPVKKSTAKKPAKKKTAAKRKPAAKKKTSAS